MLIPNMNATWAPILTDSGGTNWSHWISLSTNVTWRRVGESGTWYRWDSGTLAWIAQGLTKLPSDLVTCISMAQAG